MKVFAVVLIFVVAPAICFDGMKVKDLSNETADELTRILTYKDLHPNCSIVPSPSEPNYFLYNRKYENDPIELNPSNLNEIKPDKKTIVIIPGWLTKIDTSNIVQLKKAYLERYDCNIIIVDWSKYAFLPYTEIYCGIKTHGLNVADFLCALEWEEPNILLEDIHVLGHSFGAQIAAFAGKYSDLACDRKIGRITGLDPAGPLFKYEGTDEQLSKGDALFVDIIHTHVKFGSPKPTGDVDFHANCIYDQPGCEPINTVTEEMLVSDCYCPSIRSIELMAESVNSNQLIGVSCSRCSTVCEPDIITEVYAMMGEDCRTVPEDADNFLIYTDDNYPYGLGMSPYPDARKINLLTSFLHSRNYK